MGRKVATDTSGSETSARDIALMEQKLQELTERCSQLRQRKVQIEDSLQEVNRFANDGATNLKKWRMEINVLALNFTTINPIACVIYLFVLFFLNYYCRVLMINKRD